MRLGIHSVVTVHTLIQACLFPVLWWPVGDHVQCWAHIRAFQGASLTQFEQLAFAVFYPGVSVSMYLGSVITGLDYIMAGALVNVMLSI